MEIGFIGLGLIGGSMAKAFRKIYKECTIVAYNRSELPRKLSLEDGTVDIATDRIDERFSNCDFVFLCTPVQFNESYLEAVSKYVKQSCIITDVGSVKSNIHSVAEKLNLGSHFIGGHPMAGSEKTGYEHSSAKLCEGAIYPITPSPESSKEDIDKYYKLIASIGFKPVVMSYEEHDKVAAAISHLPHLAAAKLTLITQKNENENNYMQLLASTGFKDTTRIAASSADVWQQICIANSKNISELLNQYIDELIELRDALDKKDSDYIHKLFTDSKEYRNKFN